jgi:hypothetical protein
MTRQSQRTSRATQSSLFSWFFNGKAVFFDRFENPLYSRSASRFVQLGKFAATRVL